MIVDCHTQVWTPRPANGADAAAVAAVDEREHLAAVNAVDRAIVMGFKSRYLQAEVSNEVVAEYVRRNSAKLVGFAGIDPSDPGWLHELRVAQDDLNLKGVIISPAVQNFHPCDTRAMRLYEECQRRGLPIVFDQHHRNAAAKLEFAEPVRLDEVAQAFPELRIVVARMGHPWIDQTIVLLAKHANVYANVAGLLRHPWLSYTALLSAFEYGVMNKLLFGSDFPSRSPAACIEALYSVNQFSQSSSLPAIPREHLRGVVERDTLGLLGIGSARARVERGATTIFGDDE